jgi:hypothetical protein
MSSADVRKWQYFACKNPGFCNYTLMHQAASQKDGQVQPKGAAFQSDKKHHMKGK